MAIATDPIQNWAAQAQAAAEAQQKKDQTLGIDSFLTLMTAQLKNQDPLKPLEGTEFISQLATFGTVSGVQSMQTSLETLAASLRSTQTLNGSTMIGRDILASADSFDHTQGGTGPGVDGGAAEFAGAGPGACQHVVLGHEVLRISPGRGGWCSDHGLQSSAHSSDRHPGGRSVCGRTRAADMRCPALPVCGIRVGRAQSSRERPDDSVRWGL